MARTGTPRGAAKALVPPRAGEKPTRKNHFLYQSKLDLAKEILGAETETAALDAALDLVIYGEALARGTEAMAGEEYHDVLGIASEVPGTAPRG
jgi:hypothetical protein